MGIDLLREDAPDATTLRKFRRLLKTNNLTQRMLAALNVTLTKKGLLMRLRLIVDACRQEPLSSSQRPLQWFGEKHNSGGELVQSG